MAESNWTRNMEGKEAVHTELVGYQRLRRGCNCGELIPMDGVPSYQTTVEVEETTTEDQTN
jgi:hypothetical protein